MTQGPVHWEIFFLFPLSMLWSFHSLLRYMSRPVQAIFIKNILVKNDTYRFSVILLNTKITIAVCFMKRRVVNGRD